ncbi:MAG: outer membrane lipoprotein carrier protein LolA [Deltaproteobacteria bacterium]|nr:outer membrane lipoprotein carrier protein LolA [Deltaproteobacteria bacterium]
MALHHKFQPNRPHYVDRIRRIITLSVRAPLYLSIDRTRALRYPLFVMAVLLSIFSSFNPLIAQQNAPEDARMVAALVQSFYDQTTSVSAEFFQTYVHVLYQRTDRSKGSVVFKRPGMMRWDYARPNGKVVLSDGRRLMVFEPADVGESGQMYEQKLEQAQLPQALAFLTGTGRLETSFTFRLLDSRREGFPKGYVLELRPRSPSPHYERILFYVERDQRLKGLVRRVLIIDPNGNRNRFDFTKLRFNRQVNEGLFKWNPPPGTRRIHP